MTESRAVGRGAREAARACDLDARTRQHAARESRRCRDRSERRTAPSRSTARPPDGGSPRDLPLYLGRVGSSSYLRERVVFRDPDHKVGFYEDRRWTERPEAYVQRARERRL